MSTIVCPVCSQTLGLGAEDVAILHSSHGHSAVNQKDVLLVLNHTRTGVVSTLRWGLTPDEQIVVATLQMRG